MKRMVKTAICIGLTATMIASCGTPKVNKGNTETRSAVSTEDVVNKGNDFALKLFAQTSGFDSKVISPLSVSYLMGMLANGADGKTRQEILNTIGWDSAEIEAMNAVCAQLIGQLDTLDAATTLKIADYIAVNKGLQLKAAFTETVQKEFAAGIEILDFTDAKSVDTVNAWCKEHTDGMIPKIVDELAPAAVAYLMNAVLFKGAWTDTFDETDTKLERFRAYTRDIKKVQMMHRNDEYLYASDENLAAIQLPYGNGDFAMTVLLPAEDKSIAELLEGLDAARLQEIDNAMENCKVDLKLPKFTTETDLPLNDIIAKLGAPSIFDAARADFSLMADDNLFVSKMFQKAKIEVSEEGTKAAAVTSAIVALTALSPDEPRRVEFHADRSFVYIIREQTSGAILFIGQFLGE